MTHTTPQSPRTDGTRPMKRRSAGGALGGVIGAVAMSAVAGVLLTAAITPVVAVTGAAASSAIDIFEKLPDHIDPSQLAQPSTMYATNSAGEREKVAEFYDQNREMVEFGDISQFVKDAAVAEEDPRFYTHGGVDILATGRAAVQNVTGVGRSGASTITMQYTRNVLIQEGMNTPDQEAADEAYLEATADSADRKLKEMKLAISVEKRFSKDEILLGYLNISHFGGQIYGIESAAQFYFGKSAKDVSLAEAASLVSMVNEPERYRLDREDNFAANEQRRNKILESMLREGKITQQQYDEAVATPIETNITPRLTGCEVAEEQYRLGHFCNAVQLSILNDPHFGETRADRDFNFKRGGYDIMTTIDIDLQSAANVSMAENVAPSMDGINVGASAVSVEVDTGRVLVMSQNQIYTDDEERARNEPGFTQVNFGTDIEYGGSSGFQVGSTFKAFTLAEWIRSGHSVREVLQSNSRSVPGGAMAARCLPSGSYDGPFTFQNDSGSQPGRLSVLDIMGRSVNGGVVSMQQRMDLCDTMEMAESLGVHRASDMPENENTAWLRDFRGEPSAGTRHLSVLPSTVYSGSEEIAPLTMASAFGAFAWDGKVCDPRFIDQIIGPDGEEVEFNKGECRQAIDPAVAAGVAYVLQYAITNGLADHARSATGVPHFAKTGTTDEVKDNWTVGGSSKVTTAVWVGNAAPIQMPDGTWSRVSTMDFGGWTGLMARDQSIWPAIMNAADAKFGGDAFPEPDQSALRVTMKQVPGGLEGRPYDEVQQMLEAAGFSVSDGGDVDSSEARGRVARTDPESGSQAPSGSNVTIYRSRGNLDEIPGDIIGRNGGEARGTLNALGFNNVNLRCESGGGDGLASKPVVSVTPDVGSEVRTSEQITLNVDCSD